MTQVTFPDISELCIGYYGPISNNPGLELMAAIVDGRFLKGN